MYYEWLTSLTCAFDEWHEIPNFDKIGFLFDLTILILLSVLAHTEEQLVAIIDYFLDVKRLMMHHEGIARVMHDHVLGEVEELADRLVVLRTVLTSQEEKVMIEEDHPHYFN